MQWRKSPPDLMARFDRALPKDPACERRKMFGYSAVFVNGNMFTGLHQENMIVRLDAKARAEFQHIGAQAFEPMPGRVMKEYFAVPPDVLGDARNLRRWVGKAFAYAASLPAKAKTEAAKSPAKRSVAAAPAKRTTAPAKRGEGSRR